MMSASSFHRRIISGRAVWAAPLRGVLRAIEPAYAAAVALRNRRLARGADVVRLSVPVVSIGNLTVGGTGKTPMVIEVVRRLERLGRNPAVVARGYGAGADGANDEQRLIERHCPGVAYASGPDRAAAARRAAEKFGADAIVLDDGFQHRRLARDVDIVLIDATCPFGFDHLLPRGLLREPVASLRRAHLIVITRTDLASEAELERIDARLQRAAPDVPRLRCRHRVTGLSDIEGRPSDESLDGRRVFLFAAIGNPSAFRATVQALGANVVGERRLADHYRYRPGDIDGLLRAARAAKPDLLLTTAKDAVKLSALGGLGHARIYVVNICIDFAEGGDKMLHEALERVTGRGAAQDEPQVPRPMNVGP